MITDVSWFLTGEEEDELVNLMQCSRELGMEPLVETANAQEMQVALRAGSKVHLVLFLSVSHALISVISQVIGINNRNLHTFSVDLQTTNRLLADVAQSAEGVIFAALSGIATRQASLAARDSGSEQMTC